LGQRLGLNPVNPLDVLWAKQYIFYCS
jgi:hypothetical protein